MTNPRPLHTALVALQAEIDRHNITFFRVQAPTRKTSRIWLVSVTVGRGRNATKITAQDHNLARAVDDIARIVEGLSNAKKSPQSD